MLLPHAGSVFKTPAVTSTQSRGPYHVVDLACTEPQRVCRLHLIRSSCRERQRVFWLEISGAGRLFTECGLLSKHVLMHIFFVPIEILTSARASTHTTKKNAWQRKSKPMIPSYYYSHLVLRSVVWSIATVGYQFVALASGKLLGKQRDFLPMCCNSSAGVGTLQRIRPSGCGGIWKVLFVRCGSSDETDLYVTSLIIDESGTSVHSIRLHEVLYLSAVMQLPHVVLLLMYQDFNVTQAVLKDVFLGSFRGGGGSRTWHMTQQDISPSSAGDGRDTPLQHLSFPLITGINLCMF